MVTTKVTMQVTSIVEELKRKMISALDFFYHYILLFTPANQEWQYLRDDAGEISIVYLLNERAVEICRFDAVERMLFITGDISSASYYVVEGIGLFKLQRKILKYGKIEKSWKPLFGKGFIPTRYERVEDEIVQCQFLDKDEYSWHVRDEQMWLQDSRCKKICTINLDDNTFKYLKKDWKEIPFADGTRFTGYIEKCFRSGNKTA